MKYKVGDIIVSASSDSYVGEIIHISKEEDVVRHRCRKTGTEYEKSYFGFQCRYMSVEERLEKDKEFCAENIQLHQQILTMEREHNDAIATSKERRESLTHVAAERDEARRDLGEILAVIHRDGGHYTGEHGISKSVADAHATWAAVVRERDEARAEVERLQERVATQDDGLRHGEQVCARLVAERDEARAEVERLRLERDEARHTLGRIAAVLFLSRAPLDDEELVEAVLMARDALAQKIQVLIHERRQLRARLVECRPWVGVCPFPNQPGFSEMLAVRDLADDTLNEVKP